ncbi:protein FAR1-RELATED SEQUENCE 6-like isoform X2 [Actinidia eriantha]|uniref:protein FAR1-RELATED SEQUENCE 6-like isoform X2 n=1 Tax=Actinidia eriantha TaxID=165200 RepID=UPI002583C90F|nr:protein FAR1-RELATED SEQUENCE 6-like isoform X2 [Actinidia eriantha]
MIESKSVEDITTMDLEISCDKETGGGDELYKSDSEDHSKKIENPKVGMTFSSKEEVSEYYASYARQEGFEIMVRSSRLGDNGSIKYITLACARGGKTVCSSLNSFKPRPTKKTACDAKINIVSSFDEKFSLSKVVLEHNHSLSPGKTRFFRNNNKIDARLKKRPKLNDEGGVNASKNFHSIVVEFGGHEHVPFTEKDYRNFIEKKRRVRLGTGDVEAILTYFTKMQDKNSRFFYVMDLDDGGCLRNVFWADARSRAAYESFGDVISFDSTYLTSKYDMPLASFVGVNHHGQSILLGCGLLSYENEKTYIWLFQVWLACMCGKAPNAIITDQCKAIQGAIAEVFPQTRHRLCLWHIMEKIPKKLSGYSSYESIESALRNAVYDSITPNEFEDSWREMIEKYDLENNDWLQNLYNDRYRWIPAHVKDTFWAGMSTTQRNESMNAFFDGYVNSKTTLKQFIEQYDSALRSKVEKENKADHASFHFRIPLITEFEIEKQFQEFYTMEKFKEFQDELRGLIYCNASFVKEEGCISTFEVEDSIKVGDSRKDVSYNVYYNNKECEVHCSCRLFEFRGILCRHAVAILHKKKVKKVPSCFILSRWRKDLRRRHSFINSSYNDKETNEQVQRYDKLCNFFYEIAEIGAESEEKCDHLMGILSEVKGKMQKNDDQLTKSHCPSLSPCNEEFHGISKASTTTRVLSPLPVQTKCRPPSKRKESKVDQVVRKKRASKEEKNQDVQGEKNQDVLGESNQPKQKQANTSVSLGGASTHDNYPNPNINQAQVFCYSNQASLWAGYYNGVGVNTPNLVGNHPQYRIPYMPMSNQLAPPSSQLHTLQGTPFMPTSSNADGSLP